MQILGNQPGCSAEVVKSRYQALLEQIHQQAGDSPWLGQVVHHFTKVTRSYWPDLFHCYEVADLSRTNNDLEQLFGATRYHERRATGRKLAGVNLVVAGPARLPAALATRIKPFSAVDLELNLQHLHLPKISSTARSQHGSAHHSCTPPLPGRPPSSTVEKLQSPGSLPCYTFHDQTPLVGSVRASEIISYWPYFLLFCRVVKKLIRHEK